jgi:hypothetical protein
MGGDVGRHAIQAEGRRDKHAINITTPHIFIPIFISHFSETSQRNKSDVKEFEPRISHIIAVEWVGIGWDEENYELRTTI